tara:strand:+ start:1281 stop:1505 length:225 start_codon:yes stop_codon:yes gene_type:complete
MKKERKNTKMKTIDEKVKYHMRISDKAHKLYQKRSGTYARQWEGAARGFGVKRANNCTLWKDCIKHVETEEVDA